MYTHRKLRALLILILLLVVCTAIFILFMSSVSSEGGNSVCVVHLDMAIDEGAVTFVKKLLMCVKAMTLLY